MTRKEIYEQVRKYNLQDAIQAQFGDNYTRIASDKLEAFVAKYGAGAPTMDDIQNGGNKTSSMEKIATAEVDSVYEAACLIFLGLLKDNNLLDDLIKKL